MGSLVLDKINYATEKKLEIAGKLGLTGNPTWNQIISAIDGKIVSNITWSFNSTTKHTTISWNAPDLSNYSGRNPSASYIVTINGTTLTETSSTSVDVTSYIVEGTNTVEVKVRLSVDSNNTTDSEDEYVLIFTLETYTATVLIGATITQTLTGISELPLLHYQNKIYYATDMDQYNQRTKYVGTITSETTVSIDTDTSSLNPTLPYSKAVNDGTKSYIFGGSSNVIREVDYSNNTVDTTRNISLITSANNYPIFAKVGTKLYFLSLWESTTNYRIIYDLSNNTYTSVELTSVDTKPYNGCATACNADIYIFSRYSALGVFKYGIIKYSTTANEYTELMSNIGAGLAYDGCNSILYDNDNIVWCITQTDQTTNEKYLRVYKYKCSTNQLTLVDSVYLESTAETETTYGIYLYKYDGVVYIMASNGSTTTTLKYITTELVENNN